MQQEERDECAATITQHQGFFVNTGELQVTSSYGRAQHVEEKSAKKKEKLREKKSTEKKMDKSVTTSSQTQKPKK